MLFTELRFVLFFVVVFGVHWALRWDGARKSWLLLASWSFYAAWDARFLGLILLSTLVDYVAALRIAATDDPGRRRGWLLVSLLTNLGILGVFKYFDFFADSAVQLAGWLGIDLGPVALELVLPVGISFYTFQTLSYTLDVYRGQLQPNRSLRDVALFVAFFPQLVAGPIVRASEFLPQLQVPRRFAAVDWRPLLGLFLVGWFKKACLADQVAPVVDAVFADPSAYAALDLWLGAALYAVQIYGDFSGYSDMAIATAGMLGYALPKNFDAPYLAANVSDFWRRWHISLSSWFRDYLYVPLGGNRRSAPRTYANLGLVFLLCGLWHGAAWPFVLWGLYHGALLIVERLAGWSRRTSTAPPARVVTLLAVLVGWVLFRSPDVSTALHYVSGMLGVPGDIGEAGGEQLAGSWWWLLAVFGIGHHLAADPRWVRRWEGWLPDWLYAVAYGVAVAVLLPWAATGYQAFIYFQF